jgi:hypothetical protein
VTTGSFVSPKQSSLSIDGTVGICITHVSQHRDIIFACRPFLRREFLGVDYNHYNKCSASEEQVTIEQDHVCHSYIATMSDNGGGAAPEAGEEELAKAVHAVEMETIRQALLETNLEIGEIGDVNKIYGNARSFVKLSQGNDTVQEVVLYQYDDYHRDYKTLRVLGKGFGNLEALQVLTIRKVYYEDRNGTNDDDDKPDVAAGASSYWQALTGALDRLGHNIELRLDGDGCKEIAAAIQGLSTIRAFHSGHDITWQTAYTLISALVSLPSLENVTLGSFFGEELGLSQNLTNLTNLLKSPSLRSIEFITSHITELVSYALSAAFKEGSCVTDLRFTNCYHREDSDYALIETIRTLVHALQRDVSVKTLSLVGNDFDEQFYEGITFVVLVNTTLVDLTLHSRGVVLEDGGRWLQPLFVAMQVNKSLKRLDVDTFHLTDESVCGALRDALSINSVLESLTLHSGESLDDASVLSWRKTLPFIRDNESLKSLTISFSGDALDPHVATLCFDTVAMLEGSTTLECLDMKSDGISPDAYFAALESLQPSWTLKTLRLSPVLASMGNDKMKQLVSLVRKNYSLAALDEGVSAHDETGEVGTLLRLNQVGRCYLIKDAASNAQGVEVLIGVSDDLGCMFYHLLENPTLCDIEHE